MPTLSPTGMRNGNQKFCPFSPRPVNRLKILSLVFAMAAAAAPSRAGILLSFNFNDITSASISTLQYQTGNRLVYNATFADWARSGFHATHAIQLSGAVHGGPGDYAIMIYGDNTLTQQTAFAANASGVTYYVSYDIGPSVYTNPTQATQAGDTFLVRLLRDNNSVLAQNYVAPGAWSGTQTFTKTYFSYVGDGSGPLRIKLESGNTQTRFAGAIDNLAFWDSVPTDVPEPQTALAAAVMLVAGAGFRRGHRRRIA
ncbi:MAG: hypothetical protein WC708_07195 [Lentisphaeria bacterium]